MSRARLLELLKQHAYRKERVVLASGKASDFFIDCKRAVLLAEGHALVGRLLFDAVQALCADRRCSVQAVAGVELGGCPLASAVSLTSFHAASPLDALFVRKSVKDHGTRRMVEGLPGAGTEVALLEDVVTTGGSTLRAADTLEAAGYRVAGVVALVDRQEGGREAIAARYPITCVYTRDEF